MKQEQLNFILSQGYKEYPTYLPTFPEREHKLFCKPVSTAVECTSNAKEPQYNISYTCCSIHNIDTDFFSIYIRASSKSGTWYSLEAYSLSFAELKDKLRMLEFELKLAWENLEQTNFHETNGEEE